MPNADYERGYRAGYNAGRHELNRHKERCRVYVKQLLAELGKDDAAEQDD